MQRDLVEKLNFVYYHRFLHLIMRFKLQFLLTLSFLSIVTFAQADVLWPGWLGAKRNGWVSYFNPPKKWPQQLTAVWRVPVGDGYGSPVVKDGLIYLHTREKDDEVVWCLDLKTGKTKWRNYYPVPFKMGGGGEPHGKGPKANPILAQDRFFTMGITGILTAWDARTGSRIWVIDHRSKFGKRPHPYWGATTSPLVVEDRLFIHFGNDDKGFLVALDIDSGNELWRNGKNGAAYSSPLYAEFEGVRQIIEWNHEDLQGVEIHSGRQLWKYHLPHRGTNQNMPTPTVHDGHVLVGGENRGLRSIHPHIKKDKWIVTEKWHQKRASLDMSTAVINRGQLYGMTHHGLGQLFCVDTKNGKIIWQGTGRAGQNATFLSIPGYIVTLLDDGELQIIEAKGAESKKIAEYNVADRPTWAAPVLLKEGILIKDRQELIRWSFTSKE